MFYIGIALIEGMLGEEGEENVTVLAHFVFERTRAPSIGPRTFSPVPCSCEHYLVLASLFERLKRGFTC